MVNIYTSLKRKLEAKRGTLEQCAFGSLHRLRGMFHAVCDLGTPIVLRHSAFWCKLAE